MAKPDQKSLAKAVLERTPKSAAKTLGIDVGKNTPAPLYQWLLASLLSSARISADQAEKAANALFEKGWKTPKKMADTSWEQRVKVLNHSGYARYDESTSRYIGDTTETLLDRYDGDLRKLREVAKHKPNRERELLQDFKGIGKTGADIFCREAQIAWDELYPFADKKALDAAAKIGLPKSAKGLSKLVDRKDLPRLLSGLVQHSKPKAAAKLRRESA